MSYAKALAILQITSFAGQDLSFVSITQRWSIKIKPTTPRILSRNRVDADLLQLINLKKSTTRVNRLSTGSLFYQTSIYAIPKIQSPNLIFNLLLLWIFFDLQYKPAKHLFLSRDQSHTERSLLTLDYHKIVFRSTNSLKIHVETLY